MSSASAPSVWKRLILHLFLVSFFASFLPMPQIADALQLIDERKPSVSIHPGGGLETIRDVKSADTRYGLVAILVDEDTYNGSTSSSGFFSFLGSSKISQKIQTYAEDVQSALPWTKSLVLTVTSDDTPVEIQRMLEQLYFEGDPNDSDETSLTGVVIIGQVPLPVINKNGNRFISMLPYTDFEDPAYLLDSATLDFLPNSGVQNVQSEVWHGLIVPPLDGKDGLDLLGNYFEKNHAFHSGDEDATTFNKKVFLGDWVTEESAVNPTAYDSYQRYLGLWKQLAYYQYSTDLVEKLYTEMQDSIEPGDGLDNDGDGQLDEEALNQLDDDGDGLVDEDLGDGFYEIDNDLDGSIDEDGYADNNNDASWRINSKLDGDDTIFGDRLMDEDPPGDSNGDGCPGVCGIDDNGDSEDSDGDGYPNGWETENGYDWSDEKYPWQSVEDYVRSEYGESLSASKATEYLAAMFSDGFDIEHYQNPTCLDSSGVFHPEWDDDEDGFCDEDGSTETMLWKNDSGTPASSTCAYNDADCDGQIDEDPSGYKPEALFDNLPDIQVKPIVESLINRYVDLFEQPQGVWNRLVNGTGRYQAQASNSDRTIRNDYDTSISLIAKKDEYALRYITLVNDALEAAVDGILVDNLVADIPLIAGVEIEGEYTTYSVNGDGEKEFDDPKDMCKPDGNADLEGKNCLQFVNNSGFDAGLLDDEKVVKSLDELGTDDYYIAGKNLSAIDSTSECSIYAGTEEEGGQFVQYNSLYSLNYAINRQNLTVQEAQNYRNCLPEFASYLDDIPELCDPPTVLKSIKAEDGGKVVGAIEALQWEVGAGACYEFRELETFNDYTQTKVEFNNWLTKKIRVFRKEDDSDDEATYQEFLDKVDDKRNSYDPKPNDATLRKHFDELDLIAKKDGMRYTMIDLMKDEGINSDASDDDVDLYIAMNSGKSVTVNYPNEGRGMGDVSKLKVKFDTIFYYNNGEEGLTSSRDYAKTISSYYRHTNPKKSVLNAQIENAGSPNLPIDATRRVTFLDNAGTFQSINYLDVFSAEDMTDLESQVVDLSATVALVSGGSSFTGEVDDVLGSINTEQLADALAWRKMSIDEKHRYILTHYLGDEEPVVVKARQGYEIASLILDGDAQNVFFSFNGDKPLSEEDPEYNEALFSFLGESEEESDSSTGTIEVVELSGWLNAIQEWLEDIQKQATTFPTMQGQEYCTESSDLSDQSDSDGDGIPDGAEQTASLAISSDYSVLRANGQYMTVTVSAKTALGEINSDDAFTKVELLVSNGNDSISILGPSSITVTGGMATFTLESGDIGSFILVARPANRLTLSNSNVLTGTVEDKEIYITTYYNTVENSGAESAVLTGTAIDILDTDGNVVSTLDPETGNLVLKGAEAELREADASHPTRIAITKDGTTLGVYFLIPSSKKVSIGDGASGVFIQVVKSTASAVEAEDGIALEIDKNQMGLVTELGQIAVADGYLLDFDDAQNINIYDPIHVVDSTGETVFTVTIKDSQDEGVLEKPEGTYKDYLSSLWLHFFLANAEVTIPDHDADLLDDLEEWTIGTKYNVSDTDGDSFGDGQELFSGYDPLDSSGGKLFTDIGSENSAFHDLAVLFVRGVIKGYSDGSFRPDNPITREEFLKIDLGAICKTCDRYTDSYEKSLLATYNSDPFPDSDINPELLACVAQGKVDGIVSGYAGGSTAGYFVPKRNISRAEATKVLVETGGFESQAPASGEPWYAAYVQTAKENNLFPESAELTQVWLEAPITRIEFVMMAVNLLEAKDCRSVDTDEDGLSDTEETLLYGTDPTLADTDEGGVNDFDEIIRGSDPLDASDDFPSSTDSASDAGDGSGTTSDTSDGIEDFSGLSSYKHDAGIYAVSETAQYEEVAIQSAAGSVTVPIYTSEVDADGESQLTVRGELRNLDGDMYTEDNSTVIEFVLSSSEFGTIDTRRVQVSGGKAETVFTASTKTGDLTVSGTVSDGSLPSQEATVHVIAGDPQKIELSARSSVLPAGAESTTDVTVSLYDAYGNLANNGFNSITLTVDNGMKILDLQDEDSTMDGTQVTTPDGFLQFRVLASPDEGNSTITALLTDGSGTGASFTIANKAGLSLKMTHMSPFSFVGVAAQPVSIIITAVNASGFPVSGFQGEVSLNASDAAYGSFASETATLTSGTVTVVFSPGTQAGVASLIVESPGLEGTSAPLTLKPGDVSELRIRTADGADRLTAGERQRFVVEGYDEYGNLVTTDSTSTGTLRLTDITASYGTLSSPIFTLNQGQAVFSVTTGEISGKINLVATSSGILSGTFSGDVDYSLGSEDFMNMNPQNLYMSLLGGPYGDVTQENYIGGWMTFNGRTQAITSLISEPVPHKRIASVDAQGAIELANDGLITQTVSAAGSELPMRVQWRSFLDDSLWGELFFVLPSLSDQVSVDMLSSYSKYTLEKLEDDSVGVREDSAVVAKIRPDGQIVILDSAYSLAVNGASDGLSLVLIKNADQIALFTYDVAWAQDVETVESDFDLEDWDTLSAGVYIKPSRFTEHRFSATPTGNSTANPMGLALFDPNAELSQEMQPSSGYQSLESAEDNGDIGWEMENKHVLLFAAGNSVGESNMYYPSEIGVVLGDPTIRIPSANETNELGFSTDIGTQVLASQDEILELLDTDYNGDGLTDVLVAYKDGRIKVLQNANAAVRLKDRGEVLSIENGIHSIDKGDINGDRLEDLIIVTEDPCRDGESCMYAFTNIGGGYTAENILLDEIDAEISQVKVADLNNDKNDDLIVIDENMVMYIVWNSDGAWDKVDKIKDFGLQTDSGVNLAADLAVHYDGQDSGSISLPVTSSDFTVDSSVIDTDLDAFLSDLVNNENFSVTVDGGSDAASASRKVDIFFESADQESVAAVLSVQKIVGDSNGGSVEVGDSLTYTISLENVSGGDLSDVYISDAVSGSFSFAEDSLTCLDCSDEIQIQSGTSDRAFVYGPLSLVANAAVTVQYSATVRTLPSLQLLLSQDLFADYTDDDYLDIGVSLDGNTTGALDVFYSNGITDVGEYDQVTYKEKQYSSEDGETEDDTSIPNPFGDEDGNGIPDFVENVSAKKGFKIPTGNDPFKDYLGADDVNDDGYYATDELYKSTTDKDADGLNDTIDSWVSSDDLLLKAGLSLGESSELETNLTFMSSAVDELSQKIERVVSMFTCNGGCIAVPGSVSFFTPGFFHAPLTGAILGFDMGMPIFGILPFLPVVCSGAACYASQVMRIYLSPTTTLGLGLAVCTGPWGLGQCFAYSLPVLDWVGFCDAVNGFIADAFSKASDYVSGESGSVINTKSGSATQNNPSGLESTIFSNYVPSLGINKNIQIPGFPAVFTEWWKAQKQEFFKMLDLPDITFIYPDPKSFTTEFTGIRQRAIENNASKAVKLDTKIKIEELRNGIMGLEKWLNIAHALPLIDITPEIVTIRYPALTAEEIEIVKRDWELWIKDTKEEWKRFKSQFEIRKEGGFVDETEQKIFDELQETINEIIGAMETNMAVLDGYGDIPRQILILRDIQAYYAKTVICYLDAILSNTAGYLKENVDRVEAWVQWAVDMTAIIQGWKLLIDLSVDLMNSCDKCTNQRYSGLQLLLSLFVFVPEFPVVTLPKLPDIVIDVSNIQAGLNIVWPDLHFVPEPINIPEIPRIHLPTGRLTLDLDLDLKIPTLPSFVVNLPIPDLPPLVIPDLPSLPPAPKLPELDPSLKLALNIASNILKIVCVIRQGFVPVPELMLKSKIEEITERPGFVLPIDLAFTVEWPPFNFDFVKEIRISTYLDLTMEVSVLYDLLKSLGDKSNEMVGDLVQKGLNEPFQLLQERIQKIIDITNIQAELNAEASASLDAEEGSVDASGEAEIDVDVPDVESYNEALDTALAYKDHPLVKQEITALGSTLNHLQKALDDWGDTLPETVYLAANEHVLAPDDPLLNRYDDIIRDTNQLDQNFLAQIQDTPLAGTLRMRDSMIAYVEDFEQGTNALRGMDSPSFMRYLAQENLENPMALASSEADLGSGAGSFDPSKYDTGSDPLEDSIQLSSEDSADETSYSAAQTTNRGLYLYNAEKGIQTRLIAYNQEADERTRIVLIDIDDDGDEDIIYSIGGDVFLKENQTDSPSKKYVTSDPTIMTVADLDPGHGAVHSFKRGKNDYQKSSFSFAASPDAVAYELQFYDSLDAEESAPDENLKRLLLLERDENNSLQFFDGDGVEYTVGTPVKPTDNSLTIQADSDTSIVIPAGMAFSIPTVKMSRLVLTDLSGKAVLLNGWKRTAVHENGELSTQEAVTLQSTEKTLLKITEGNDTARIELPAYTIIRLGRGQDRTIRVESGDMIWIEEGTEVAEQTLEEGTEIFSGEAVSLESSRARASLQTSEGGQIDLDNEELFTMNVLLNSSNPSGSIEIENGAYTTVIRGLFSDGSFGPVSDNILLNPQICGDTSAPYPIISEVSQGSSIDVAIFSTKELSAEASFDSTSEIVDAVWDLDSSVDADGDGNASNDEEWIGLTSTIGPYQDTEPRTVILTLTDTAGNKSQAEVSVNVYVPNITLTEASVDLVSGTTDPTSPSFPFTLVRDRDGALNTLLSGVLTNDDGTFAEEMVGSDLLSVFDAEGNVIAEFNTVTKQLLVYDTKYASAVIPSEADWPSRLLVYEKSSGTVMGSFIFVSEEGNGIGNSPVPLNQLTLQDYSNVLVYPEPTGTEAMEWSSTMLSGRDSLGSLDFTLTETGNIAIYDSKVKLVKRSATSLNEPLIIDLYVGVTRTLQIWPGSPEGVTLTTTDGLGLSASTLVGTGGSMSADTHLNFEDLSQSDTLYSDIAELVERGVLEGYDIDDKQYFKPDQSINRAEFTKIVLSILCIVPRSEAYYVPSVFSDITDSSAWYYAYTKEAYLLDLITGYLGEVNGAGLAPFKAENTITRAEASKILLEALDAEGIVTLPDSLYGEPWYEPYIEIAQDLSPYLNQATTAGDASYILTAEEASDPSHKLTRYEFVEMSIRVLKAYNCFDLDSDGDGLVNFDEENIYGTDAYNPDTDSGGVSDGTEVGRSTDPLDGSDDFGDSALSNFDPGTYAVREACSTCPCYSNIDWNSDLRPGDSVFAIIQNATGTIFGESNHLTISPE